VIQIVIVNRLKKTQKKTFDVTTNNCKEDELEKRQSIVTRHFDIQYHHQAFFS
jgi:hypothetical protein